MEFLGILCLILVSTTLFSHVSVRIGVPAVIGQLLVGIILGPALLNWVHPDVLVHEFSEIGVIILMFMAGLESDLKLLQKYLKPGVLVALLGIAFPVLGVYLIGLLFNLSAIHALFLGIVFAATSVSISVEVLKELKALDTKEGATILGAAVVDDIVVVIILSVLISLIGQADTTGGSELPLGITILEQVVYFVGVYLIVKFIAPYLIRISKKIYATAAMTIVALVICLAMAFLADLVGLSSVVGAFFAGVAVAQSKYHREIDQNIQPIGYAVFIPVFFVSIGLNMTFDNLSVYLPFILVLTVVALLTKLLGGGIGAKMAGFSLESSYIVGAGMISRGEMALIIAQIGRESKLLSDQYYSPVIMVIILTTLLAPFILEHAVKLQKVREKNEN